MREVVKYNNSLNRVCITSLNELEQNILFTIFAKCKNLESNELIEISSSELGRFCNKNLTKSEMERILEVLREKIFKINFSFSYEDNEYHEATTMIFSYLEFVFKDKSKSDFIGIKLRINEHFNFLLNFLHSNFTYFELVEFSSVVGKYTKTIYRILKQFKHTGYVHIDWFEFKRILNIHKKWQICQIDTKILNPAIKELTRPRMINNKQRIPFKNLAFKKIKQGRNVVAIEFRFDLENEQDINELISQNNLNKTEFLSAKGYYFSQGNKWLYIENISLNDTNIIIKLYDRDLKVSKNLKCSFDKWQKDFKPYVVNQNNKQIFEVSNA